MEIASSAVQDSVFDVSMYGPSPAGWPSRSYRPPGVALGHQFNAAAGQVADVTRDIESAGQGLAGVAEAHPLDPARIMEAATLSMHAIARRKPGRPIPRYSWANLETRPILS